MRLRSAARLGALVLAVLAASGCNPKVEGTSTGCVLNSDCNSPLVCVSQECREQCSSNMGCPNGQACVPTDGGNVCVLSAECANGCPDAEAQSGEAGEAGETDAGDDASDAGAGG